MIYRNFCYVTFLFRTQGIMDPYSILSFAVLVNDCLFTNPPAVCSDSPLQKLVGLIPLVPFACDRSCECQTFQNNFLIMCSTNFSCLFYFRILGINIPFVSILPETKYDILYFFFLLIISRSSSLYWIGRSVWTLKSQRLLCVLFTRRDSTLNAYHFPVCSKRSGLYSYTWITSMPIQICFEIFSGIICFIFSVCGCFYSILSQHRLHLISSYALFIQVYLD